MYCCFLFLCVWNINKRNAFIQYRNAQLILLHFHDGHPITTAGLTFPSGRQILLFLSHPLQQYCRISKASFAFYSATLNVHFMSHHCDFFITSLSVLTLMLMICLKALRLPLKACMAALSKSYGKLKESHYLMPSLHFFLIIFAESSSKFSVFPVAQDMKTGSKLMMNGSPFLSWREPGNFFFIIPIFSCHTTNVETKDYLLLARKFFLI